MFQVRALFTVQRTRLDLLPFYSRLAATMHPYIPEVSTDLCNFLKQDFKYHVRKKVSIPAPSFPCHQTYLFVCLFWHLIQLSWFVFIYRGNGQVWKLINCHLIRGSWYCLLIESDECNIQFIMLITLIMESVTPPPGLLVIAVNIWTE